MSGRSPAEPGTPGPPEAPEPPEPPAPPPPRIFVPPPLLFAAGFAAGWLLRAWAPGDALPPGAASAASRIGIGLAGLGAAFSLSGVVTLVRAHTTLVPFRAATRLVTHGPYRLARNPMYTGLAAVYLGAALVANRIWPVAFLPVVFGLLMRHVVGPEERYLEARFGDAYRAYRARVRRFLVV